mgnify:FL=1
MVNGPMQPIRESSGGSHGNVKGLTKENLALEEAIRLHPTCDSRAVTI